MGGGGMRRRGIRLYVAVERIQTISHLQKAFGRMRQCFRDQTGD